MGGPTFDRQVFVKKQTTQKSPSKSPLPGGLVLVLVAALSAFATYRFVKAGGTAPENPADKAKIEELQGKLKTMQSHIDELESRRKAASARQSADDAKTKATKSIPNDGALLAEDAPRPPSPAISSVKHSLNTSADDPVETGTARKDGDAHKKVAATSPSDPAAKPAATLAANQMASNKELHAIQGNLAASHDEWQATTDRLGNVVGELDSQQNAIKKTQSGVNYLLERVQRSDVTFTLTKGSGLQRVGPLSMELESTSVKGQHYSLRMMVDDKSVELKDRALNEVVQFYTPRSQYPLRLIVSQIDRGQVAGTLAVPTALNQESSSHQLQER